MLHNQGMVQIGVLLSSQGAVASKVLVILSNSGTGQEFEKFKSVIGSTTMLRGWRPAGRLVRGRSGRGAGWVMMAVIRWRRGHRL
jgi:hypothetical protein